MIRYFFDMENGEENRELFRGLDIERAGEKYMREQGTRPVVFLTLKDIRSDHWEGELEKQQHFERPFGACGQAQAKGIGGAAPWKGSGGSRHGECGLF